MSSPHRSPVDHPDHRIPDEDERILEERRTALPGTVERPVLGTTSTARQHAGILGVAKPVV